jgi:putative nucleotidyltransferase with HDIG domain
MEANSSQLTQKLSDAVERMPAFPKSVQRVLELTRDINCPPKELIQVIEKDPVITVKVLKVLNSAWYSLPKKITSINQSVVFLGINTIKNLAISIASMGILPAKNAAGFDNQQFLLHSLTTASIAKLLCSKLDENADPTDCYIAGLLHDFGKVVFAQFMPQEFSAALARSSTELIGLDDAERQIIGADHTLVGSMLTQKWQLPSSLTEGILHHHHAGPEATNLQNCLFVADQISKKLQMGFGGNAYVARLPDEVANHFGGNLDDIIASLGDLDKVVEEARAFAHAGKE